MKTMQKLVILAAALMLVTGTVRATEKTAGAATTVVRSSLIDAVFYDYSNRTLTVFFRKGGTYEYLEVPQQVYENLVRAPSVGRFYHAEIRRHYTSRKLDPGACAAFIDRHEDEARW